MPFSAFDKHLPPFQKIKPAISTHKYGIKITGFFLLELFQERKKQTE